ncbi:PASTA domain-containing protein [Streptococcus parasuis]|uniref:PASTA domain-containing protein n=1 Tax=Streptococcus parasuis TaxID=1501662 RepID=UPI0024102C83|nr:PASTA domain-containing protein [Streptococcus parasuis]MDG3214241.1 PASTA domain-containing protein [Streptococcus suis]WJQ85098.1 PASTA domain-containing protein [Streptococcus parasuis]
MAQKNNLLKNLNKLVDIITDTTKIIGDTVQAAAPILDKALDRQHEKNLSQIQVPNVIDLVVEEAKRHLEEIGFRVTLTLVKPNKKYRQETTRDNEVVDMIPKAGKFDKGSLIKLYYINQEIIDASNQEVTIPNLIGLTIPEAREHLQEVGFKPAMEILTADAKYAKQKINVVIDMEPKANLFTTTAVKGSLIKLKYLDEETLEQSQQLASQAEENQLDVGQLFKQLPNLFGNKDVE